MRRHLFAAPIAALLAALPTQAPAEVPRVVTDIAPVQSLAAIVLGDLGAPAVLLGPDADPHHAQLRPSQARALSDADLVVWMGAAMTPWLQRMLDTVAEGVPQLDLLAQRPLPLLVEGPVATFHDPARPAGAVATGETIDPDHLETDGHGDGEAHGTHDEATGHSHGPLDPHAWLDPLNAAHFLGAIAERLAGLDPANAGTYRANAAAGAARLAALTEELRPGLQPARRILLVPAHDAYGYFLMRFDLRAAGALSTTDAAPPGAARLAALRSELAGARRACVFTEAGGSDDLVRAVIPGPNIPVLTLDPLGARQPPGPALYEALIRAMAAAIRDCVDRTGAG